MVPQKRMISPSLMLETIQTDRFKTEALSVTVAVPVSKDRSPLYALALSCLKRGTEKFPTQGSIGKRLDELYGAGLNLRSARYENVNLFGFSTELISEEYTDGKTDVFDGVLDIILQMLFHPLLDDDGNLLSQYVESEKDNLCDVIEARINNPRAYALRRCREIMFEGDDYGIDVLGTVEQLRSVTAEQVTKAYRELVSKYAFRVFYVGFKSADEVEDRIKKRLSSYIRNGEIVGFSKGDTSSRPKEINKIDEKMKLSQGKLVLGFRTPGNLLQGEFYPVLVLADIFGGSPVSKLFMNVRERLGLCYYCGASYDIYKGVMFVSSGVDPAMRETAEKEILRQLDEMRDGNITKAEYDASIKSLISGYCAISDLPSSLESFYEGRGLFGVDCTVAEFIENIKKVTVEDVIRAAHDVTLDTVYFLYGDQAESDEEDEDVDDFA